MASSWSVIRGEIEATLEAHPFHLRRVKEGSGEDPEGGIAEAGDSLARDGYLIAPRSLDKGDRLELVSHERICEFDLLTMTLVGSDYDIASDVMMERCELLIQYLRDCNRTVPSAILVDTNGPISFREVSGEATQIYATMPMIARYRMP
jgi:hypothetical protein